MLATSDIIAFVSTAQPERARAFYGDVLGLRLVADDPFALLFDVNGLMLRVSKTQDPVTPTTHTVLGWHVRDIAAVVDGLAQRGVVFERFGGLPQDARGVWQSPSGARVAWFRDPDGNLLSLTQL